MSHLTMRRLPVPIPPFPAETPSYLGRLAAANHLDQDILAGQLHEPATSANWPSAQRLAAVTGRPLPALRHALPELSHPESDQKTRQQLLSHRYRRSPACRWCAARRGITRTVIQWTPDQQTVCLPHRCWTGYPVARTTDRLDLDPVPDVVRAARRHRSLIRRHGPHRVQLAHHDSLHIVQQWTRRQEFGRHRDRRLEKLCPYLRIRIFFYERALHAASYPEAVTLTGLLVSPHWLAAAAAHDQSRKQQFYAEAARRLDLPEYKPYTATEPLTYWTGHNASWMLDQNQSEKDQLQ